MSGGGGTSRTPSLSGDSRTAPPAFAMSPNPGAAETTSKIRKGVGRLSENMHLLANEPSLALFCLQEHIRKEVPNMIKQRTAFSSQHRLLQGTCYDIDYSIGAVKSMEKSQAQFSSIQTHLKNALFLKQQLKFEEGRKKQLQAASKGK